MKTEYPDILFKDIKSALKRVKKKADAYFDAESNLFDALSDAGLELDMIESKAPNADTLQDAISFWLQYDEYGLNNIMKEIKAAYLRKED